MTDYNQIGPNQEIDISGLTYDLKSLFAFLLQVKDIRHAKGKIYSLVTLLVLILMAKLGGEDTPTGIADWVSNRVDQLVEMKILPKAKAPCHMTYRRVLQSIVTPEELERLISQFHQSQLPKGDEATYSMDGKTVRGTIPGGETRGTHLLSVSPSSPMVLSRTCPSSCPMTPMTRPWAP